MPKRDDRSYKSGKSSNPRSKDNKQSGHSFDSLEELYNTFDSSIWGHDSGERKIREASALSFMSGLPLIGGVIRGVQSARYMDDYYRNSGFIPSYPGLNDPYGGYSGLGRSAGNIASSLLSPTGSAGYNVKEGTNDLMKFYNYAYQ